MKKTIDCVVCGSTVADLIIRPFPLSAAVGPGTVLDVAPIGVGAGGLVSNAAVAFGRLGMNVAAFGYVGDDDWGTMIRRKLDTEGVDAQRMLTHPSAATSTAAVLIDSGGHRSFAYAAGATEMLDREAFLENLELFAQSRMALIGYYSFLPNLENDLPEVLAAIRSTGCRTALDSAGDGGRMQPLDRILPHLDVYVPSHTEAAGQTGQDDPQAILQAFRRHGATGLLGVKLGAEGALLSPAEDRFVKIAPVLPPGEVIDTTGAGDAFYAGLLTGLLRDMDCEAAGRLGAAAGACCVTGVGTTASLRNYEETARLAGIV